ncbi:MAG: galactose mutarotase [Clostridia bacterium]|nr:galactose mutarotase [Clostridia bacterium]
MIQKQLFGNLEGQDVFAYTLDNGRGLKATVITYGGIIRNLEFNGVDVVLGRETLEEYLENDGCLGAAIGRNSNRIKDAKFDLNGKTYTLFANNNGNNLHGGKIGFNKKVWDAEAIDGEAPAVVLSYLSPDGEEGFPGNADVKITYTLTRENAIKLHYEGVCDQDTIMNLTNHSYFNLNGHDSGAIDSQTIQMVCSFFTPNTEECMPYGEILKVDGTPFDMRLPKTFKDGFSSDYPQATMFNGFDHNFMIDGKGYRLGAVAKGDKTGITMEMYTDAPAVQLYTANFLKDDRTCKDGVTYGLHHGFCLETQDVPNAINIPFFKSPILKEGEKYDTTTEYRFK